MTPAYYAALCNLSDDLAHAFAEVPLHTFGYSPAKSRTGSVKAVGSGPHAGRVLYGAQAQKALAGKKDAGAKAKPAAQSFPGNNAGMALGGAALGSLAGPVGAAVGGLAGYGVGKVIDWATASPAQKAKAVVAAKTNPPKPAAPAKPNTGAEWAQKPVELGGQSPPPPPAATKHLDEAKVADTAKYGGQAASILHRTGVVLLRFFLKGLGAAGGAAIGAAAGFGLSGGNPIGAIAGGLAGGALGANSLTPMPNLSKNRVRAMGRKVARAVVPRAAGVAAAAPLAGLGAGGGLAMGAAGMPIVGAGLGAPLAAGGVEMGLGVSAAVRRRMATSAVSKRKAKRQNDGYSESFAEGLPPDAVPLLKARVIAAAKAAGIDLGDVPDEVIAQALAMANQDADAAVMSECFREARRAAKNLTQLARV